MRQITRYRSFPIWIARYPVHSSSSSYPISGSTRSKSDSSSYFCQAERSRRRKRSRSALAAGVSRTSMRGFAASGVPDLRRLVLLTRGGDVLLRGRG